MNTTQAFQAIEQGRVIAILRGDFGNRIEEIAAAVFEGGIAALEITLNSPNALDSISRIQRLFDSRMAIGAGTVLTTREVDAAAEAGAQFIVSPNVNPAVIQRTKQLGLISLPGCFTPTEIVCALDHGADAAKLFPAHCLGPGFVRAIRAPMPGVCLVPTGGVTPELARAYFAAGAWAVGVGSELVPKSRSLDIALIRNQAKLFAAAART